MSSIHAYLSLTGSPICTSYSPHCPMHISPAFLLSPTFIRNLLYCLILFLPLRPLSCPVVFGIAQLSALLLKGYSDSTLQKLLFTFDFLSVVFSQNSHPQLSILTFLLFSLFYPPFFVEHSFYYTKKDCSWVIIFLTFMSNQNIQLSAAFQQHARMLCIRIFPQTNKTHFLLYSTLSLLFLEPPFLSFHAHR